MSGRDRFRVPEKVGGIIWGLSTNWQLPHVTAETDVRTLSHPFDKIDLKVRYKPMGYAIEYHALHRSYASQDSRSGCLLVPGGVCYSDAAFLAGDELLELLIEKGGEAVWAALEARYHELPEKDVEPEPSIVGTEAKSDA